MRRVVCAIFGHIPFFDVGFNSIAKKPYNCGRCGILVIFVNNKGWVKFK